MIDTMVNFTQKPLHFGLALRSPANSGKYSQVSTRNRMLDRTDPLFSQRSLFRPFPTGYGLRKLVAKFLRSRNVDLMPLRLKGHLMYAMHGSTHRRKQWGRPLTSFVSILFLKYSCANWNHGVFLDVEISDLCPGLCGCQITRKSK